MIIEKEWELENNIQDDRDNSEELAVTGELLSIVNLLPPCESVVDPLVLCEGGSFLPVEEVIRNLVIIIDHHKINSIQFN